MSKIEFSRFNSRDDRERRKKRQDNKENDGPRTWVFLKQDKDKFEGYALFTPDPNAEDNPGYLEYAEHWDGAMGKYIPCWGKENGCTYCAADLFPSTRALGAFYVTEVTNSEDDKEFAVNAVRVFRLNWKMLQTWWDNYDEDGSPIGKKIRIKAVDKGSGVYTTTVLNDELSEEDLATYKDQIPDLANIVQTNLDAALVSLRLEEMLQDTEVTESELKKAEEEMPKQRGGKEDDAEFTTSTLTITAINTSAGTISTEELESDLYMSSNSLIDLLDDLNEGDVVTVTYGLDDEDDFVAKSLELLKPKRKIVKK